MAKVKVALVQMSCGADKHNNLNKAIEKTKEAAAKGAQIVCLQELFTSLFLLQGMRKIFMKILNWQKYLVSFNRCIC